MENDQLSNGNFGRIGTEVWYRMVDAFCRVYFTRLIGSRWPGLSAEDIEDLYSEARLVLFGRHPEGGSQDDISWTRNFLCTTGLRIQGSNYTRSKRGPAMFPISKADVRSFADTGNAESLASERRMVLFEEAMSILSDKEQKMVCGYHLERKSMEELAGDVGYCSAGSAKKAKCLAMGKMRTYVEGRGFSPDGYDHPLAA